MTELSGVLFVHLALLVTGIQDKMDSISSLHLKLWLFFVYTSISDLKERLGKIVVAYDRNKKPILAKDINAHGAMTVLLKDAMKPNLVQTLENNQR